MAASNHTIAVLENDLATSTALGRLLRAQGFLVQSFASGEAWFARDCAEWPDCLLLDIHLDGMSGLEVQRRIRAASKALPIVFMTGQPDLHTEHSARRQGCSDYLHKPIDARLLALALDIALRQPPAGNATDLDNDHKGTAC